MNWDEIGGSLKTPLHYKDSDDMKMVVPMVQGPSLSQKGNVSVTKMEQIYGFHEKKRPQ